MTDDTSHTVLRRTRGEIPARRSVALRRRLPAIAALIALVALAAGFVLRPVVEAALVLHYARGATGLDIDAGRVERSDGGYTFYDVTAATPGGFATLRAPRVDVTTGDSPARIIVRSPRLTIVPAAYRGDEAQRANDALQRSALGRNGAVLDVRDGGASVTGSAGASLAEVTGIAGSASSLQASVRYAFDARLTSAAVDYPLSAHGDVSPERGPSFDLTAPALPLPLLGTWLPASREFVATGGVLRDVRLHDAAALAATAHLEGASFELGTHALRAVHGPLVFAGDGAGSAGLSGTLDGAPFSAAGEMHDLGPHFAFAHAGSNDFADLIDLTRSLADAARLTSLTVEAEAPGLTFGQYGTTTEHGPLAVSVLAVDPREPTLRFDTAIAEDHVVSGGERTSAMGLRTGAVGGVNGDYFDIGRTYQPQGMLVRAGALVRGPVERAALAIDRNRHVTFAEFALAGRVRVGGKTYPVTQFNSWPAGAATVITPDYGKDLPPDPGTTFARLERSGTAYRIAAVESADTLVPAGFGVAFGAKLGVKLHVGEPVALTLRTDPPTDGAVAAIGGGPILVRDGAAYEDPHAPAPDERNYRWPVVALAQAEGRLLLVAVDGRHPERSVGMMRPEFSDLLLRLGARDAMALDSGGSVTLVSRKVGEANVSVRNVPSDNSAERWVSDGLFLYSSAPPPTIVPPGAAPTPVPEARPAP